MNGKTELKDIIETLTMHPRFADCSVRDLTDLARRSTAASVPANWPLIHELTPADACYVILTGEVEIIVDHKPVASLGAGSVVGEVGLARHRLRNATVLATTPVSLLHIPAETFNALIESRPSIKAALLSQVAA